MHVFSKLKGQTSGVPFALVAFSQPGQLLAALRISGHFAAISATSLDRDLVFSGFFSFQGFAAFCGFFVLVLVVGAFFRRSF